MSRGLGRYGRSEAVIPWYGFVVLEDDANIWEGWSKCDSDFNTEYFHPSELVAIFHYDNNARSISSFNRFEDDYTVASTRNSTPSESDGSPALRGGGDTQAALLNGTEESDCELDMMAASAEALPPAFHESELLLLSIYLRAYTLHAFHGATHITIPEFLEGEYALLCNLATEHRVPDPGLQKMARTIPTVEHRLGIDSGRFISYHFLCLNCQKRSAPNNLFNLKSASCTVQGCPGTLYQTKRLRDGKEKRTPTKLFPVDS
jgi:hypothetical protein